MSAQHTPRPVSALSPRDMKTASDIAVRFWEPRRNWPAGQAAESLRNEARRLHAQAMQSIRREIGGVPHIWHFTASMLAIEASRLDSITKTTGRAS